jgi:hypothetical protein
MIQGTDATAKPTPKTSLRTDPDADLAVALKQIRHVRMGGRAHRPRQLIEFGDQPRRCLDERARNPIRKVPGRGHAVRSIHRPVDADRFGRLIPFKLTDPNVQRIAGI